MADTFLLQRDAWDLCVDAARNIAVASSPYAPLQDAASAGRTFAGEPWYDTTQGIPYFGQVFTGGQPVQILKARMTQAAQAVPGVASARVVLSGLTARTVTGQLQVTLDDGSVLAAGL